MSNDMRIVKFETLIRDINEATKTIYGFIFRATYSNLSLLLIYDYEKINDYAKVIVKQSNLDLRDWNMKYSSFDCFIDSKIKIEAAKELVRYCRSDVNRKEAYKFIFWAMMVLTVDKTDAEEKLSLICDFARMLQISDDEMIDIVQVIKVLYHEESEEFEFKSEIVSVYFSRVLNLYK